jgi:hypothetical protein
MNNSLKDEAKYQTQCLAELFLTTSSNVKLVILLYADDLLLDLLFSRFFLVNSLVLVTDTISL